MGFDPPSGIDDEIARVTHTIEEYPNTFLALSQGDQNGLGGMIRKGGKFRMFDFDCGGFRHCLREGLPARMTWGCMKGVPGDVVTSMDQAYRDQLSEYCPNIADDEIFNRSMVEAFSHWHIFHVIVRLRVALENDHQRGPSTLRQQLVAWLESYLKATEQSGEMQALGEAARQILDRLHSLWLPSDFELPVYDAFNWDLYTILPIV